MDLDKAIKSRRSVRKFKSKTPDWRAIIECIDLARYAPSAGNNFTLQFIVVDNKESIKKLAEACQQDFISKAQYVVVVCSNKERLVNAYGKKGESFNKQQAGSAIQNFLLALQERGLSTCWIGYFVDNLIKKELKIPENIEVEALFPIGYESEKPVRIKEKIDLDAILYFNVYKNKRMKGDRMLDV